VGTTSRLLVVGAIPSVAFRSRLRVDYTKFARLKVS
jgi:hypothetical protein